MKIFPVLIADQSDKALWPIARQKKPQQFAQFMGQRSSFQQNLAALDSLDIERPVIFTQGDYEFIVRDQLADLGLDAHALILADTQMGELAALLTSILSLDMAGDDLVLALNVATTLPASADFTRSVFEAAQRARKGRLVRLAHMGDSTQGVDPSALYVFSKNDLISAIEVVAPALVLPMTRAAKQAERQGDRIKLKPDTDAHTSPHKMEMILENLTEAAELISLDAPLESEQTWKDLWENAATDDQGVFTQGPSTAINCRDSLLISEQEHVALVGLGLERIAAIATGDAVLVVNMDDASAVSAAVDRLSAQSLPQTSELQLAQRPWGSYQSLALGERFQVKRIVVKPGGKLSLQSHVHRSEHWVVVSGTARVTVGAKTALLSENQSTYIPVGEIHRLENPGRLPLTLIEVQSGPYLGEDDIVRFEDVYARETQTLAA